MIVRVRWCYFFNYELLTALRLLWAYVCVCLVMFIPPHSKRTFFFIFFHLLHHSGLYRQFECILKGEKAESSFRAVVSATSLPITTSIHLASSSTSFTISPAVRKSHFTFYVQLHRTRRLACLQRARTCLLSPLFKKDKSRHLVFFWSPPAVDSVSRRICIAWISAGRLNGVCRNCCCCFCRSCFFFRHYVGN